MLLGFASNLSGMLEFLSSSLPAYSPLGRSNLLKRLDKFGIVAASLLVASFIIFFLG
jgi:hypothetical protein